MLLSDRVHRELKRRLILWEYLPAEQLREEALAEEFSVSRTPVRDALRRLEREGFLEHRSWAGYRVPKPDLPRLEEHYEVRLLLEVSTVRKLAMRAPVPELAELMRTWQATDPIGEDLDPNLVHKDEQFHERLAAVAGNSTLLTMLRSVNEHIRIIRSADFVTPQRVIDTHRQHLGILGAIQKADPDGAARAMSEHILESQSKVAAVAASMLARILTRPVDAPPMAAVLGEQQ